LKISGYSRRQLTRLIAQYRKTGRLQLCQRTVSSFKQQYTEKDIRLLAAMDERYDTPCGQAVKKLCERACGFFGQTQYSSLASICVSHLYKLRKSIPQLSPPLLLPGKPHRRQGKQRKIYLYENMITPYGKPKSLPNAKDYLKPGVSFEILDHLA
jgi:hypothetical protein